MIIEIAEPAQIPIVLRKLFVFIPYAMPKTIQEIAAKIRKILKML